MVSGEDKTGFTDRQILPPGRSSPNGLSTLVRKLQYNIGRLYGMRCRVTSFREIAGDFRGTVASSSHASVGRRLVSPAWMLLMCFRSLTALLVCLCVAGWTSLLVGCRMAGVEFFPQSSGAENEIANDSGLAVREAMNAVNPHATQPLIAPPPKTEKRTPLLEQNLDDLLSDGMSAIRDSGVSEDPHVHLSLAESCAFQAVLDGDPNSAAALQGMGIVADLSQDWPAAEHYYSRALSFKPNDADLINNLGYSYLLQNRLAEATQTLTARSRAIRSMRAPTPTSQSSTCVRAITKKHCAAWHQFTITIRRIPYSRRSSTNSSR